MSRIGTTLETESRWKIKEKNKEIEFGFSVHLEGEREDNWIVLCKKYCGYLSFTISIVFMNF